MLQRVFIALLVLVSAFAAPVAMDTATASETIRIDAEHPLASDQAVEEFAKNGKVSGEVMYPHLGIKVADDKTDVGLSEYGLPTSTANDFLQITNHDAQERTVRLFLPQSYFGTFKKEGVESVHGKTSADFKPIEADSGARFLAVTVSIPADTSVVFSMSTEDQIWGEISSRWQNKSGISSASESWEYIDAGEISGENETGYIIKSEKPSDVLVQRSVQSTEGETRWINVDCSNAADEPIGCRINSDSSAVVVYSNLNESETPEVRYKKQAGVIDTVQGALQDISQIPERVNKILRQIELPF